MSRPSIGRFQEHSGSDLGRYSDPSLEETAPDFQTQLADPSAADGTNEANENTIERTYLDEQLSEQQEELLTELGLACISIGKQLPVELEASEDQAPSGLSSRDELVLHELTIWTL